MNLLDRYIARQYLMNTCVLLVVLFCFVVGIDVSINFGKFVSAARDLAKNGEQEGSAVRVGLVTIFAIFDFWWPKLLQLFNYMIGLVLVGGMGFTCAQMVRTRELTAVLASGLSLYRVARPIVIVALVLTGLQALNQEFVIPRIAPLLVREHDDIGKRALGKTPAKLGADGAGRLWYAREFDADKGILRDLHVVERDREGLALRAISAPEAKWNNGAWELVGGEARSRRDQSAPVESVARLETDLDVDALRVRRFENYRQSLSWMQIGQMLSRPALLSGQATGQVARRVDELERIRWGRIASMTSNMLALAVCMPFFLRREPTNMLTQSIKGAPVAITAILGGVLGSTVAIPGVPPQISVFVACLILLPIVIMYATSVRT
jgi:lipopolysaccharide export system permease protein